MGELIFPAINTNFGTRMPRIVTGSKTNRIRRRALASREGCNSNFFEVVFARKARNEADSSDQLPLFCQENRSMSHPDNLPLCPSSGGKLVLALFREQSDSCRDEPARFPVPFVF